MKTKIMRSLFCVAALFAVVHVQAQIYTEAGPDSDLVLFGPASNPGGFVGYIHTLETDPSEFYPAFLPASANVPDYIGIQLYEDPSQTVVSDQLWTQAGFWYFASDPNLINFAQNGIHPVGALVEDGTQQDVSAFFLLPPGSMSIQSDIVPEPATFALAGLSSLSLLLFRRQRK